MISWPGGFVVFQNLNNAVLGVYMVAKTTKALPADVTCFVTGIYVDNFCLKGCLQQFSYICVQGFAGCKNRRRFERRKDIVANPVSHSAYGRSNAYKDWFFQRCQKLSGVFGVFI